MALPQFLVSWVQTLNRWRQGITRSKIMIWSGGLLIMMAIPHPWYSLPADTLQAFGLNLFGVTLLKSLTLITGAGAMLSTWRGAQLWTRFLYWQALGIVLFTPYLLTTWVPSLDAVTTALYDQNQQVTRHVEHTLPTVQGQWKQTIALLPARSSPSTVGLIITDRHFLQPASWDYLLLEGLGYHNHFLAFLGNGWVYSVLGISCSLLGVYADDPRGTTLRFDLGWVCPQFSSCVALIAVSILGINILNYQLDQWLVEGRYPTVIATSQLAERWYPSLRQDEAFQERLASAERSLGLADPFRFELMKGLEHEDRGEYRLATHNFQRALEQCPTSFLARHHSAIAIINSAVDYVETPNLPGRPQAFRFPQRANFLDSHKARQGPIDAKPSGAIPQLEQALQVFPNHMVGLYDLMLAHNLNRDVEQSAQAAQQLIQVQHNFQQPNTALLGQAYLHLTWSEYDQGDLEQAWQRYRQSVDPSRW